MMDETIEIKRKRLYMRSIRRGIKEMDLILQAFAEAELGKMDAPRLDLYDRLLSESDHDLYQWVNGQLEEPEVYRDMMGAIRSGAVGVTKP